MGLRTPLQIHPKDHQGSRFVEFAPCCLHAVDLAGDVDFFDLHVGDELGQGAFFGIQSTPGLSSLGQGVAVDFVERLSLLVGELEQGLHLVRLPPSVWTRRLLAGDHGRQGPNDQKAEERR